MDGPKRALSCLLSAVALVLAASCGSGVSKGSQGYTDAIKQEVSFFCIDHDRIYIWRGEIAVAPEHRSCL